MIRKPVDKTGPHEVTCLSMHWIPICDSNRCELFFLWIWYLSSSYISTAMQKWCRSLRWLYCCYVIIINSTYRAINLTPRGHVFRYLRYFSTYCKQMWLAGGKVFLKYGRVCPRLKPGTIVLLECGATTWRRFNLWTHLLAINNVVTTTFRRRTVTFKLNTTSY